MTPDEIALARRAQLPADAIQIGTGCDSLAIWIYATAGGKPCACAYVGRSLKSAWRYAFKGEIQRAAHISDAITAHHRTLAAKAERRESRKAERHGLQLGDVLVSTWGYDQTNVDYYEVTRVMERAIEIRPIRAECVDPSLTTEGLFPVAGSYTGEPMRKIPHVYDGRAYVTIESYAVASKWEGRPMHATRSECGH
jgi:hypothetical protein